MANLFTSDFDNTVGSDISPFVSSDDTKTAIVADTINHMLIGNLLDATPLHVSLNMCNSVNKIFQFDIRIDSGSVFCHIGVSRPDDLNMCGIRLFNDISPSVKFVSRDAGTNTVLLDNDAKGGLSSSYKTFKMIFVRNLLSVFVDDVYLGHVYINTHQSSKIGWTFIRSTGTGVLRIANVSVQSLSSKYRGVR